MTTTAVRQAVLAVARAARAGDPERESAARAVLAVANLSREIERTAERGVRLDRDQAAQLHAAIESVTA